MFILSLKLDRNKLILISIAIVLIILLMVLWNGLQTHGNIGALIFNVSQKQNVFNFSNIKTSQDRVEFLKQFGWAVEEKPIEIVEIQIPEKFDNVYSNYNDMQKNLGLDLSKYSGRNVKRYTYKVLNHPLSETDEVRANILIYKGNVVAGDIMTTSLDGFMQPLIE